MTKRSRTRCTRRSRLAKDDGGEEDGQGSNAAKDWPLWPPPENRCPVSTLDSNVALPMYRTFMAHKYQELSMISLLYYQETLTADGGTPGDQNCYLAQFYIVCPTPTGIPGVPAEQLPRRCDAGLPPIRPRKRHSIRRDPHKLSISLAPKFNLPSGLSFPEKTKSEGYREPAIGVLAVPVSGMEL